MLALTLATVAIVGPSGQQLFDSGLSEQTIHERLTCGASQTDRQTVCRQRPLIEVSLTLTFSECSPRPQRDSSVAVSLWFMAMMGEFYKRCE